MSPSPEDDKSGVRNTVGGRETDPFLSWPRDGDGVVGRGVEMTPVALTGEVDEVATGEGGEKVIPVFTEDDEVASVGERAILGDGGGVTF
jgi:hypothetical protein